MNFFIHLITYLFSAPIAKYASGYLVIYAGITPSFIPVCIEMSSYILVQPINYIIVDYIKLITKKKKSEIANDGDYVFIDSIPTST